MLRLQHEHNARLHSADPPPAARKTTDVVFEIDLLDGAEAERLGPQQAAVIRDVVLWHHRTDKARHQTRASADYYKTKLACTTRHPF